MDHLDVLCRLIEYDTSGVDGRGCLESIRYLERLFIDSGCEAVRVSIPPAEAEGLQGRVALLAHRRMRGKPRLLIYGHIDVVPAEGWHAFTPLRKDGRVYGRGASDMKGAIAALVGALWRIRDRQPEFDVTVVLTMDEETHQMAQLRYLTEALDKGPHPHVMSLDAGFGYVTIANLGLLQMDITVHGDSVHSALAHLGRNAIEDGVTLIEAVRELKQHLVQRKSALPAHPSTRLAFMEPRLNVNQIHGGIARNIVPDQCTFTIDRRLLPEESVADARAEILDTLHQSQEVEWVVSREFSIPSVPPCRDPLAQTLAAIIRDVTGSTGLYGDMLSGELPAAARCYWGGDAFSTGVIRPDNHIHGNDEFAYESDLDQLVEVLARFLTSGQKEAA
jgi:succinyl-diaminopimelate desuccinylase